MSTWSSSPPKPTRRSRILRRSTPRRKRLRPRIRAGRARLLRGPRARALPRAALVRALRLRFWSFILVATCCNARQPRRQTVRGPCRRRQNETPKNGADRGSAIYRALRHAIIEQALEPGAKLPEDAIGERFGASRTIVRHVLGQLAAEGLVELRRNHGAMVATPSWDEARDVFDVRLGLEALVVARLAGRLTPEQIRRLNAHVDEEERARGNDEPLLNQAGDRVSHSPGRDDRKPGADPLRQRERLALRPDACALQPAALLRMRGQRAPRHHRGAREG